MRNNTLQLKRLIKLIRKKWIYMLLAGILTATVFCMCLFFSNPSVFVSEITVYVNNSSELKQGMKRNVTTVDLMVSEILVPTYITMLKSNTALEDTVMRSGISGYTADDLREAITVETVSGTALVKIAVTDKNPKNAERIANSLIETMNEVVAFHIEGSSVGVIDKASAPVRQLPQGMKSMAVSGFLTGFFGIAVYLYIRERKKALISSEDDLKKLFDLPLLGSVPYINTISE